MHPLQNKWNRLTDEKKKKITNEIIHFFEEEHDREIGIIAAGNALDFFMETVGKQLYTNGLLDGQHIYETRLEEAKYDIEEVLSR